MTSGTFQSIPLSSISKGTRQRRQLREVEVLAESISRLGLINPITVSKDRILVAGERRLEACRSLGWSDIPIQFAEQIDEIELKKIELEENIKRLDLPWQDQVLATEELHNLMKAENPSWTTTDTAEKIGISQPKVVSNLAIAREMVHNPRVVKAQKISIAKGLTQRAEARRKDTELQSVTGVRPQEAAPSILHADFSQWAESYQGPRFNLIHCDFPFGVDLQKSGQMSAQARGVYEDRADVYWKLLKTLYENWERLVEPAAHLLFWFSMKYYSRTLEILENSIGAQVSRFPLFWLKSDGAGILPDPQRGPRQVYETAFFGHTGDRKIIGAVANAFAAPTGRDSRIHVSEKPIPVLHHFFKMLVDENTTLLDPTCGSGTALRCAESLGAKRVLGLERDKASFEDASRALAQARALRKVSEMQQ